LQTVWTAIKDADGAGFACARDVVSAGANGEIGKSIEIEIAGSERLAEPVIFFVDAAGNGFLGEKRGSGALQTGRGAIEYVDHSGGNGPKAFVGSADGK